VSILEHFFLPYDGWTKEKLNPERGTKSGFRQDIVKWYFNKIVPLSYLKTLETIRAD
jgi:hypothetical protein